MSFIEVGDRVNVSIGNVKDAPLNGPIVKKMYFVTNYLTKETPQNRVQDR